MAINYHDEAITVEVGFENHLKWGAKNRSARSHTDSPIEANEMHTASPSAMPACSIKQPVIHTRTHIQRKIIHSDESGNAQRICMAANTKQGAKLQLGAFVRDACSSI